jgi:hypothetical protein
MFIDEARELIPASFGSGTQVDMYRSSNAPLPETKPGAGSGIRAINISPPNGVIP